MVYFNPRLREGGDREGNGRPKGSGISIHASEKEATKRNYQKQADHLISIHASEKEATVVFPNTIKLSFRISIHASEKEATDTLEMRRRIQRFQSTPPRRRRRDRRPLDREEIVFQSTPPRRRRHIGIMSYMAVATISIHASEKEATICIIQGRGLCDFNPRLREGGDCNIL